MDLTEEWGGPSKQPTSAKRACNRNFMRYSAVTNLPGPNSR